ncbi:hypothetical protein M0R45_000083 [Rubus argutus]|uniref:Uncharacterized protein n=1 Tax=Rubus argutus TaxID=59490 RepID=A0AAW1VQU6_RUBAR
MELSFAPSSSSLRIPALTTPHCKTSSFHQFSLTLTPIPNPLLLSQNTQTAFTRLPSPDAQSPYPTATGTEFHLVYETQAILYAIKVKVNAARPVVKLKLPGLIQYLPRFRILKMLVEIPEAPYHSWNSSWVNVRNHCVEH